VGAERWRVGSGREEMVVVVVGRARERREKKLDETGEQINSCR
jgi:hypothetical protein